MDEMGGFEPVDTSGFISAFFLSQSLRLLPSIPRPPSFLTDASSDPLFLTGIESIRIKQWALANVRKGQSSVATEAVYGSKA